MVWSWPALAVSLLLGWRDPVPFRSGDPSAAPPAQKGRLASTTTMSGTQARTTATCSSPTAAGERERRQYYCHQYGARVQHDGRARRSCRGWLALRGSRGRCAGYPVAAKCGGVHEVPGRLEVQRRLLVPAVRGRSTLWHGWCLLLLLPRRFRRSAAAKGSDYESKEIESAGSTAGPRVFAGVSSMSTTSESAVLARPCCSRVPRRGTGQHIYGPFAPLARYYAGKVRGQPTKVSHTWTGSAAIRSGATLQHCRR